MFENLTANDAIFLVTVRDNDVLWLVAVIEKPARSRGVWSGTVNTTPITDITKQLPKLVLASGVGIQPKPGKLGMSLQTRACWQTRMSRCCAKRRREKPGRPCRAALPTTEDRCRRQRAS